MRKAETRIEEEQGRAKKFLDLSSYDKARNCMYLSNVTQLKKEIDMVLVAKHKDMLQVECESYFRDDKRDGKSD